MGATGGPVRIVPTGGAPRFALIMPLFFVLILGVVYAFSLSSLGAQTVGQSLLFETARVPAWSVGFVWAMLVVVPLVMVLGILTTMERSVEVRPTGVRVVSWIGSREYLWNGLRPWWSQPSGNWTVLAARSARPGWIGAIFGRETPLTFYVSREQAYAVLTYPNAPVGAFPPSYGVWLDLPDLEWGQREAA